MLDTKLLWTVSLILALVATNVLVANISKAEDSVTELESLGGPVSKVNFTNRTGAALGGPISPSSPYGSNQESSKTPVTLANTGAALGLSSPASKVFRNRDGLKVYKVQKGDTLSEIASRFEINTETVKLANPEVGSSINPGDELKIPPVSGILYKVKDGDTLIDVADEYGINPELIKKYNTNPQKLFDKVGSTVVLPYAEPKNKWTYLKNYQDSLRELAGFFQRPLKGFNWGELHYKNAVDIANECGVPIKAAAEGVVSQASTDGFWNEGHGNFLILEHSNGTKTKYSHISKSLVSEGDYVLQGEKIALVGNSGNTHGPTGCHLHFEVRGAENPFARK